MQPSLRLTIRFQIFLLWIHRFRIKVNQNPSIGVFFRKNTSLDIVWRIFSKIKRQRNVFYSHLHFHTKSALLIFESFLATKSTFKAFLKTNCLKHAHLWLRFVLYVMPICIVCVWVTEYTTRHCNIWVFICLLEYSYCTLLSKLCLME